MLQKAPDRSATWWPTGGRLLPGKGKPSSEAAVVTYLPPPNSLIQYQSLTQTNCSIASWAPWHKQHARARAGGGRLWSRQTARPGPARTRGCASVAKDAVPGSIRHGPWRAPGRAGSLGVVGEGLKGRAGPGVAQQGLAVHGRRQQQAAAWSACLLACPCVCARARARDKERRPARCSRVRVRRGARAGARGAFGRTLAPRRGLLHHDGGPNCDLPEQNLFLWIPCAWGRRREENLSEGHQARESMGAPCAVMARSSLDDKRRGSAAGNEKDIKMKAGKTGLTLRR